MIDRMACGLIPPKPHTVFRDSNGVLFHEEMFTRGGFGGAFSYFYHRYPITPATRVTVSSRGHKVATPAPEAAATTPLKRRLYDTRALSPEAAGTPLECRIPLLFNQDLTVYAATPSQSDDVFFANGDGDELWFIEEGSARIESVCGWLSVEAGDYVMIPRSLIHRWHLGGHHDDEVSSAANTSRGVSATPAPRLRMMGIEAHRGVAIPKEFRNSVGQFTLDAPYTHRDFVRPTGPIAKPESFAASAGDDVREVIVKKGGAFTHLVLEHSPMDVVGWEGFVYPWAFAIRKFQPKTGLIHLPPTIHATFSGPGFLVCSFVPRVTDTHPDAIPCPYPHSSVDCDEVIFYVAGNFTSRRGVGPGAISLHPAGIAHGPHPGAYEGSIGSKRTGELAVMIDTFLPLRPTAEAFAIENPAYHDSWRSAAAPLP